MSVRNLLLLFLNELEESLDADDFVSIGMNQDNAAILWPFVLGKPGIAPDRNQAEGCYDME